MAIATFYIIEQNSTQDHMQGHIDYVIYLADYFASQGAKVYINAQDRSQAEAIDESLWQRDPEQFQAHNLVGEGPQYGTPIEIGFSKLKPHRNRQLVINMANDDTNFAETFTQVVDFVPCEEKAKQLARERYKIYRQKGFEMQTIDIENVTRSSKEQST
ncbi:DNA polymerase III subunit chi [Vibrio rumoiensis]|uniref:DNA polymerase III subunit chi n=1 Tax=Vibrio rumoiensis 1S-45 TaxID=1188252 RepID=A0A1E5E565_9VIBR|nr:DNA polymerase III subunit chi [Vibrio rumoiensis]OEF28423.1 DNA polymerase III subunit chi [Vibrio rumoiensis 1S-45]